MKPKKLPQEEFNAIYSRVPRLCVDLVVITDQGVLLSRRNITPYKGMWHTPGGTILKGETLEAAVKRVALEEIGVDVKIEKLLGPMEFLRDGSSERHTVSLAFEVRPLSLDFQSDEQSDKIAFFQSIPQNTIPVQKRFLQQNIELK
jgi:ADP-ribose pyrophosphatase YjhB (NUDIX family)